MQGEISEADPPTIRLGATSSGLISDSPPSSPIFTPDALPAATLQNYPGVGQAPSMLASMPSGLELISKISMLDDKDVVIHMVYKNIR